jgi:UDP-2-acetamido-3-amino-2,3-dideoxy-glucuronate N-acetyltransferase
MRPEDLWPKGPPPGRLIHPDARLASDVEVYEYTTIRERAIIGAETRIGRNVYIDHGVIIGSRCKIQNACNLYHPAVVGSGVFIGPGVLLLNDRHPRAINMDGSQVTDKDWKPDGVTIGDGASIGAGAIIMPGVSIGAFAVVGAGSIVLDDVPGTERAVGLWKG